MVFLGVLCCFCPFLILLAHYMHTKMFLVYVVYIMFCFRSY